MIKKLFLCFLISGTLLYSGCGNESNESNQTSLNDSLKKAASVNASSNAPKIFALPAPLQIATALKNANIPYNEKQLTASKSTRIYPSDYMRALNLGVYTIDIGYSVVYNQRQTALNYHSIMDKLISELNIVSDVIPQSNKRFEKNIDNTDSLCTILLDACNGIQKDFQVNKREYIGWYITSGGYIEGLYLALNTKGLQQTKEFNNLLGQQKLFLDNVLEVSNYLDKRPEFDDLYLKLGALQELFAPINVTVKDNKSNQPVISCVYTTDQLKDLLAKVTEIRNSIIK